MSMQIENSGNKKKGMQIGGGSILSFVGIGALATFMLQNTQDVRIEFLVWDFTWPVWLLTLFSAVFGAAIWIGMGILRRHRRRKARREDRRG